MRRFNMHLRRLSAVAISAIATTSAQAEFTGLYAESLATSTLPNTTLVGMTYRIYAQFDDPADRLIGAFDADLGFHSQQAYQVPALGTNLGPHPAGLDDMFPNLAADSYVAVNDGMPSADAEWDEARFASGQGIGGGWFLPDSVDPAGLPDANGRVLLLFLTFLGDDLPQVNGMITTKLSPSLYLSFTPLRELILGDFWIAYEPADGELTEVRVIMPLTPSAGALALFGVAGLVGKRRRRD